MRRATLKHLKENGWRQILWVGIVNASFYRPPRDTPATSSMNVAHLSPFSGALSSFIYSHIARLSPRMYATTRLINKNAEINNDKKRNLNESFQIMPLRPISSQHQTCRPSSDNQWSNIAHPAHLLASIACYHLQTITNHKMWRHRPRVPI